jgi:hypothetical protein
MERKVAILFAVIAWFAVLTQYYLMIGNRVSSIGETTIRFFSFFTILTNLLVAIYFSYKTINLPSAQGNLLDRPGSLTAITVYITIVGLVYQVVLRHIWEPKGLQMIVDELLHSIIPLCVIAFWYFYENKSVTIWAQIPKWLIYPLIYLIYVLVRGNISGFYPYPFVDVSTLGLAKVLLNGLILLTIFLTFSILFVGAGRLISRNKRAASDIA